jgi:hypothetical protein
MKKNREGFYVSETERECTKCRKIFTKTSKTTTLCNICNTNRVKCYSVESKMYQRAKSRAKENNLEFSITKEDIFIPEYCPILNIPIIYHSGSSGGKINSPALDRIDNTKGYVKGNVLVISHLANMMKSCANKEHLLSFSKWIVSNYT